MPAPVCQDENVGSRCAPRPALRPPLPAAAFACELRMPCPCSSTHSITPARTLCISGGTLKKRTALSLKLPPVVRAQVEFEATARILGGDDATLMLHLRVCIACFAALDVLSVGAFTSNPLACLTTNMPRPPAAYLRTRSGRSAFCDKRKRVVAGARGGSNVEVLNVRSAQAAADITDE